MGVSKEYQEFMKLCNDPLITKCANCKHSNLKRKNDIGEIRCTRYSMFISPNNKCDSFYNKFLALNEVKKR